MPRTGIGGVESVSDHRGVLGVRSRGGTVAKGSRLVDVAVVGLATVVVGGREADDTTTGTLADAASDDTPSAGGDDTAAGAAATKLAKKSAHKQVESLIMLDDEGGVGS